VLQRRFPVFSTLMVVAESFPKTRRSTVYIGAVERLKRSVSGSFDLETEDYVYYDIGIENNLVGSLGITVSLSIPREIARRCCSRLFSGPRRARCGDWRA